MQLRIHSGFPTILRKSINFFILINRFLIIIIIKLSKLKSKDYSGKRTLGSWNPINFKHGQYLSQIRACYALPCLNNDCTSPIEWGVIRRRQNYRKPKLNDVRMWCNNGSKNCPTYKSTSHSPLPQLLMSKDWMRLLYRFIFC